MCEKNGMNFLQFKFYTINFIIFSGFISSDDKNGNLGNDEKKTFSFDIFKQQIYSHEF